MSLPGGDILKKATNVKLYYFDARGRAEKIRLVLAAGGIKYENVSVSDWPSFKPKTPYGSLPVLEVDGKMLGGSSAILRFVAAQSGLSGSDCWDAVILDGIVEAATDIENAGVPVVFGNPDARQEAEKKLFDQLPRFLEKLESVLKATGSGWFSKKGLTWADVMVFNVINAIENFSERKDFYQPYPLVSTLLQNVANSPGIKEYLASRPAAKR